MFSKITTSFGIYTQDMTMEQSYLIFIGMKNLLLIKNIMKSFHPSDCAYETIHNKKVHTTGLHAILSELLIY